MGAGEKEVLGEKPFWTRKELVLGQAPTLEKPEKGLLLYCDPNVALKQGLGVGGGVGVCVS